MPVSANTVWEVRSSGNNNNGGGFVTGASGTDYSQQNAAQYALTGVTSSGAGNVFLTASAAADMVGNILQVISGTNFRVGFYEVVSVVVGVSVTCSTNGAGLAISSGVGANGVINIGGSLATIGKVASTTTDMQPGNIMYVKGSFTLTATDGVACVGTTSLPIRFIGYGTVRGDGYLGRSGNPANGPLITTNMPTLTYNAGFSLNNTGTFCIFETMVLSGNRSAGIMMIGVGCVARACSITNSSVDNAAAAASYSNTSTNAVYFDCDILHSAASGTGCGLLFDFQDCQAIGCRIRSQSSAGFGVSFTLARCTLQDSLVYNCGNIGVRVSATSAGLNVLNHVTITGCTGDGIDVPASTTQPIRIVNTLVCDNGGKGIDLNNANVPAIIVNCSVHSNTGGDIVSGTGWVAATNWGAVTGSPANSDFVAAGSQNYNLVPTSGAFKTGLTKPVNIGAYQNNGINQGGGIF